MKTLEESIRILANATQQVHVFENFSIFKVEITCDNLEYFLHQINSQVGSQIYSTLEFFFKHADHTDRVEIKVIDNLDGSAIQLFNTLTSLKNFQYQGDAEEASGAIIIEYIKSKNDYRTIYHLDSLSEYLNSFENIEEIFLLFHSLPRKFKLIQSSPFFCQTEYFVFCDQVNFDSRTKLFNGIFYTEKRKERRNKILEHSHFANSAHIHFLPEDFYFQTDSGHSSLTNFFNKLALSLTLSKLCDASEFKNDTLHFKLNGYKSIKQDIYFKDLDPTCLKVYYDCYQDIFEIESNLSDKLGLARNVISIHISDDNLLDVNDGVLNAIRSNYSIYLKENVKKYIEVKNKITDTIFSLSDKFNGAADELLKSLKTSFYTLTTMFASVILLKIVKGSQEGKEIVIFSTEVYLFFLSILGALYLFKLYSLDEVNKKEQRLLSQFNLLKKQYTDLMDERDLEVIFDKSDFKKNNTTYINDVKKSYSRYWDAVLSIYFLIFTIATFAM